MSMRIFFFCKQKTAYEMRISDWSSDVCSSDLTSGGYGTRFEPSGRHNHLMDPRSGRCAPANRSVSVVAEDATTADAVSTALSLLPLGEAQIGRASCRERVCQYV